MRKLTTSGDQVVDNDHLLALLESAVLELEFVLFVERTRFRSGLSESGEREVVGAYLSVLELVLEGVLLAWKLAALADRHERKLEFVGDGRTKKKAAGLEADDGFGAGRCNVVAEDVDHLLQRDRISQEREDVPETENRLGMSVAIQSELSSRRRCLLEVDSWLGKIWICCDSGLEELDVLYVLVDSHLVDLKEISS